MPHASASTAAPLAERLAAALRAHSPAAGSTQPNLSRALNDAIANPGQLVRARLACKGCAALHLPEAHGLALACAVEYFHIASLIFDDLPCMDDSVTRRGRTCLHRVHGEATAILAALALINRAYALVHEVLNAQPPTNRERAAIWVERLLGANGILEGQARDLHFGGSSRSPREVLRVAAKKTGTLFLLCVYLPSLLGANSVRQDRALRALCIYWGLMYQIADDLNDVLSPSTETGKTTGRDQALNRPNYVHAAGVAEARARLSRLLTLSNHAVETLSEDPRWEHLVKFHRGYFFELWSKAVQPGKRSAA